MSASAWRMWLLRKFGAAAVLIAPSILFPSLARADFSQLGSKLVGAGYSGQPWQGYSVALSADGKTTIVGGIFDNNTTGAVWFYTFNGTTWSQQGGKVVGTVAGSQSYQGNSVALSADGNTALVGGSYDGNFTGAAWVYVRNGSQWRQQQKLTAKEPTDYLTSQGTGVALSADGNIAVVGAYGNNGFRGAAWVYTRSGTTWTEAQKLDATDAVGQASQGNAVAISADGNTIMVGGYHDGGTFGGGVGAAWIWTRSGATWAQQQKLVGSGYSGLPWQGSSVALSPDGNTAILGGPFDNGNTGAAWVFTRTGTTWTERQKLVANDASGSSQGSGVALSTDGNIALVGGYNDGGGVGAAWAYTRGGTTWARQGGKLVGANYVGQSNQGNSVSLSAHGNTAIVGGPNDNNNVGAAWIFVQPPKFFGTLGSPNCVGSSSAALTQKYGGIAYAAKPWVIHRCRLCRMPLRLIARVGNS